MTIDIDTVNRGRREEFITLVKEIEKFLFDEGEEPWERLNACTDRRGTLLFDFHAPTSSRHISVSKQAVEQNPDIRFQITYIRNKGES